jgi:hypothetical protein
MRAHRGERRDVFGVEPGEERADGDGEGGAGVGGVDVGMKKSRNRRLAFSPASAISRGTTIADAADDASPAGRQRFRVIGN